MGCRNFASWRFHQRAVFLTARGLMVGNPPFSPAPALSQLRSAFDWVSCPFQVTALEAQGLPRFSGYPAKDMAVPGSRPVTGTRTCLVLWDPFFRRCSVQGNFPHPLSNAYHSGCTALGFGSRHRLAKWAPAIQSLNPKHHWTAFYKSF